MATLYLVFFTFLNSCFGYHSTTVDLFSPTIEVLGPNQFCANPLLNCGSEVLIDFEVNNADTDVTLIAAFIDLNLDGQIDYALADSNIIQLDSTFQLAFELVQGNHQVVIAVEDTGGNVDTAYYVVQSGIDCTPPPVPVCINGTALELFQMGPDSTIVFYIDLNPEDLIEYSIPDDDVCNSGALIYSINLQGATPSVNDSTLRLDCEDYLESSTQIIEIYTWDEAGNRSSCQTYVLIFDNGFCGGDPGGIYGNIYTEEGEGLTGVNVMIGNKQEVTTNEGAYTYVGATALYDYTVQPKYDEGSLNGVSTLDILLISQHILGVNPLNSPYKMIAADVNGSQSITVLDIVRIRKIILSIDIPSGDPSWVFIDADYVFPDPADPWVEEYPTSITVEGAYLSDWGPGPGLITNEFVAIKLGDVNDNADPDLE